MTFIYEILNTIFHFDLVSYDNNEEKECDLYTTFFVNEFFHRHKKLIHVKVENKGDPSSKTVLRIRQEEKHQKKDFVLTDNGKKCQLSGIKSSESALIECEKLVGFMQSLDEGDDEDECRIYDVRSLVQVQVVVKVMLKGVLPSHFTAVKPGMFTKMVKSRFWLEKPTKEDEEDYSTDLITRFEKTSLGPASTAILWCVRNQSISSEEKECFLILTGYKSKEEIEEDRKIIQDLVDSITHISSKLAHWDMASSEKHQPVARGMKKRRRSEMETISLLEEEQPEFGEQVGRKMRREQHKLDRATYLTKKKQIKDLAEDLSKLGTPIYVKRREYRMAIDIHKDHIRLI